MRRKRKFNVYTNATIKSYCWEFLPNVQGLCKVIFNTKVDMDSIASNYPGYKGKLDKLHHFCIGSFLPRRTAHLINNKRRKSSLDDYNDNSKKRESRNELKDQMENYDYSIQLDNLINMKMNNVKQSQKSNKFFPRS